MKKYVASVPETNDNFREPETINKKIFEEENSILTELLEFPHFQTIRHFFYALLTVYIIKDVLAFYSEQQYTFGFAMLIRGFENVHLGFILWIFMFISHILVFIIFSFWARFRQEFSCLGSIKQSWDLFSLILLVTYYVVSIYYIPQFTHRINLAPIASTIIQLENLRFIMKSHSFVRSNTSKVLHPKSDSDEFLNVPRLSQFLYFSFAPTFLYKDEYLRRKKINIHLASQYFIDLLCSVWLLGFITDDGILKSHKDAGLTKISWTNVVLSIPDTFLSGLFIFLALFYIIYQCWLNVIGELLLFRNRKFYREWWTSQDFGEFFRTWNSVVQDWLHVYIYKEFKDNITPNSRLIPKLMVLFISALVHEYVLSCVLHQFFPIMFISFFVIAAPLTFLNAKHSFFNVYFIVGLGLWSSTIINFSLLEYNSKFNCPLSENDTFLRYLPRAITADCYLKYK